MTLFLPFPSAVVANQALTPFRVVDSMLRLSRKRTLSGLGRYCSYVSSELDPECSLHLASQTDVHQGAKVTQMELFLLRSLHHEGPPWYAGVLIVF